ncbi:MAG: di-trans,poly-cis-decaprenylcistransferase, partial [Clostridia bacterium]|nr:di-trans,poly-cis-decaprenylcistransferase [Clostridia bacterium]
AFSVDAFSTENWAIPDAEQEAIFKVVDAFNRGYEGDIRITYSGNIASLPDYLEDSICMVENATKDNPGTILNICFNYGGREDLLHAAEICYSHGNFTKETFERALASSHLPPVDCIVRTGGEMRLSNFMLYESAYAELIFLVKNWPDMDETDVDKIIELFEKRNRTFGA